MKSALQHLPKAEFNKVASTIPEMVKASFSKIAPFWPLKNLIAVNPLQGLEDMPFEDALKQAQAYFQQADLPEGMQVVNRETIKWMQAFFDDGQATLPMPFREEGLYNAWRRHALHDAKLHGNNPQHMNWLRELPQSPEQAIAECLLRLSIYREQRELFLTLMLSTLPGWAAHIKYRTDWPGLDSAHPYAVSQADYMALRLIITSLLWPDAKELVDAHLAALAGAQATSLEKIQAAEENYRLPLLKSLSVQPLLKHRTPQAQLVFCIDVRSEPFRRALESTGHYHTLGFAGFFGIPIQVTDGVTGDTHASCPVLLAPQHNVVEAPCTRAGCDHSRHGHERLNAFRQVYQSAKYAFTAPFALVEGLGLFSGAWMGLRSLTPRLANLLKGTALNLVRQPYPVEPSLAGISFAQQCAYAEGALRMMGLTNNFAPLVVLCGHGSTTQNNAYATALDCGACGGRHGAPNARVLAAILNKPDVKARLLKNGIAVPDTTHFIAAEHNTTTDEVTLYSTVPGAKLESLKADLEKARQINSANRLKAMQGRGGAHQTKRRAQDWAQVRPEWGLARNAAFIVAPRDISASLDLEGRCFLHSYDYTRDADGSSLTTILTAPMVVAEWINTQYLFSTLDNVAFGGGSKITKNITGKIGVMQGNASDLMTGLPLQSVYADDQTPYHEPQRLMCVVYAPHTMLDRIIESQKVLQKLYGNGWVQLACIEPDTRKTLLLRRDFTWENLH